MGSGHYRLASHARASSLGMAGVNATPVLADGGGGGGVGRVQGSVEMQGRGDEKRSLVHEDTVAVARPPVATMAPPR